MQIEVGKKYRRRDGKITQITETGKSNLTNDYPFEDETGISYTPHGKYYKTQESDLDLLSEVVEPSERDYQHVEMEWSGRDDGAFDVVTPQPVSGGIAARVQYGVEASDFDVVTPQPVFGGGIIAPPRVVVGENGSEMQYGVKADFIITKERVADLVFERDLCAEAKMTDRELTGIDASGKGRLDAGKEPFHRLPPEFLFALANHYEAGARKYPQNDGRGWEKGMAWGRCFSSAMRHVWKFWMGEEVDEETGSHHLIAAIWNLVAIYTYGKRGIGTDDRPKGAV